MPGVARRAGADRAVIVRPADAVALLAAAGHRRAALQRDERMRRPLRVPGLIGLGERDLLRAQCPSRRRLPPTIPPRAGCAGIAGRRLVAAPAVARRQIRRDHEAVMLFVLLIRGRLMAIEAASRSSAHACSFRTRERRSTVASSGTRRICRWRARTPRSAGRFRSGVVVDSQEKPRSPSAKPRTNSDENGSKSHRYLSIPSLRSRLPSEAK